ncbi:Na(+)/H(+) antiporter,-like protein [Roseibacterium elongatum DSM 19469]|uniref:Na(+)/H(+) antiporter,-like protein n=1 Tax=Roseicyclus elongatus DSM 19469 TaxID=1294273 RepID=W8S5T8_9RHOB|nr:cation:proton antiporter [Roseibacterium elongatum]AHM04201.1 Na(+)/H(+) antiporter,-like protein [Roseibacterium elongatum DSM 19469]
MDEIARLFLTLGGLFLAGLAADALGRRTALPRVTLLLLIGVAAGQSGLGLIPEQTTALFEPLSVAALTLVAFLLGNALTARKLAEHGRSILMVSWAVVLVTLCVVTPGLILVGLDPALALILAAIATATAPAATSDILRQAASTSAFSERIRGIVAVDDAWGLIVFSVALVGAATLAGTGAGSAALGHAARGLGGAIAVGLVVGLPGAVLTGRLSPGEPLQTEALGLVFLTAGLASWLDVSVLLAGLVAGAIIANFARHHDRAFHEIEHLQWPFMLLFFVMAGAVLEIGSLAEIGLLGLAYVVLRVAARIVGGWLGGYLAGLPAPQRRWIGPALLPQAGVAVGMALVAGDAFPQWHDTIVTLTVGTTVIFEILGPPLTLLALKRAGTDQSTAPGSRNI